MNGKLSDMTTFDLAGRQSAGLIAWLNSVKHRAAMNIFMVIIVAHWAEHLTQAFQIWVQGQPIPQSRGVLGQFFPWLVKSEWLHYGYAVVMLVGFFVLRKAFAGRAKAWWTVALAIQFWHHIEHLLLFVQAQSGTMFFGKAVPTSIIQLILPRVELHLLYNTAVFLPMVVAVYYHLRPNTREREQTACTCARPTHS